MPIEAELTPGQIVLLWLERVRVGEFIYPSFACSHPRAYIANAVSKAISSATKGLDPSVAQQATLEAQQVADSLCLLVTTINVAVLDCCGSLYTLSDGK